MGRAGARRGADAGRDEATQECSEEHCQDDGDPSVPLGCGRHQADLQQEAEDDQHHERASDGEHDDDSGLRSGAVLRRAGVDRRSLEGFVELAPVTVSHLHRLVDLEGDSLVALARQTVDVRLLRGVVQTEDIESSIQTTLSRPKLGCDVHDLLLSPLGR